MASAIAVVLGTLAALLLLGGGLAAGASSCTKTYTGTTSTNPNYWSDSNNWTGQTLPKTTDTVCWANTVTVTLTSTDATASSIDAQGGLAMAGGRLALSGPSPSDLADLDMTTDVNGAGGTLDLGGSTLNVTGTAVLDAGRVQNGTLTQAAGGASYLNASLSHIAVNGDGVVVVESGVSATSSSLSTTGVVEIDDGDYRGMAGTPITAGLLYVGNECTGTVTMYSPIEVTGGAPGSLSGVFGDLILNLEALTDSSIPAAAQGSLQIDSGASFEVDGTLKADNGPVEMAGGTLYGDGTVSQLDNQDGTVEPGYYWSPVACTRSMRSAAASTLPTQAFNAGTLSVSDYYTQGPGGTLAIFAPGTPGDTNTPWSQLYSSGQATLDGALTIVPANGYNASAMAGDHSTVVQTGEPPLQGRFSSANADPPFTNGLVPAVSYSPAGAVATLGQAPPTTTTSTSTTPTGTGTDTTPTQTTGTSTSPQPAPPVDSQSGSEHITPSRATLSGTVNPDGLATTVYFQYGLDGTYRLPGAPEIDEDQQTPPQQLPASTTPQSVNANLTGLLPNAQYHYRLVAVNALGTAYGPHQVLRTGTNAAGSVAPPVVDKDVNSKPVSGQVFIKPPKGKTLYPAANPLGAPEQGFIPLTELSYVPVGSLVDALHGELEIIAAFPHSKQPMDVWLNGGVFKISQSHGGLVTFTLVEGAFKGGPSTALCRARSGHLAGRTAHRTANKAKAKLSSKILQTLHARDKHGNFRTQGHYSSATVRGTVWDTLERCNGTGTVVHSGTVVVLDFHTHKLIVVHAGHHYLALA